MEIKEIPFTSPPWTMLPPPPGTCPACAVNHPPDLPHNQQSLHWQYWFYLRHQRWPTWLDAMAHCSTEMKWHWLTHLEQRFGIKVLPTYREWGNPEKMP